MAVGKSEGASFATVGTSFAAFVDAFASEFELEYSEERP